MSMDPGGGSNSAPTYTSMQQQAGLLPQPVAPPPIIFPGQVSAMIQQGGVGAAMSLVQGQASQTVAGANIGFFPGASPPMNTGGFMGIMPSQTYPTMVGMPQMFQGPTGIMSPMIPSAPYNPYPGANPYAGAGAMGPFRGAPSPFTPMAPAPPPFYSGPSGVGAVPFGPMAPPSMFDTQYGMNVMQHEAAMDRAYAMRSAGMGLGARIGTDIMGGFAGAALGARFGGAPGAAIGAIGGFLGTEMSGLGQMGQNGFMNNFIAPGMQQRALGIGLENVSRNFISSGPFMNEMGQGFSRSAAMSAAQGITALGNSADFRRETFDRFNTQDLGKIAQTAGQVGLMQGVQDPSGMVDRVRDIAKSVNAFMELAKEPDLQRALQTMGSLRSSGLNLSETLQAVHSGRTFARMAGRSFSEMAELGGAMGSSTYQSMGLTQGAGFTAGMANLGLATASHNMGVLSPQMSALVGGPQGYAGMNTMFGAGMLQYPMVAPGLMTANGGLSTRALHGFLNGGGGDLFGMASRGSSVLGAMGAQHGVEGIGMAMSMQPLLQDTIARIMQSRGPFAQRNLEDSTLMNLSHSMGMRGSAGFITAARIGGMSESQAVARAQEMASPTYWENQRSQIRTARSEAHGRAADLEDSHESMWGTLRRTTFLGRIARGFEDLSSRWDAGVDRLTGRTEQDAYTPMTDESRRDEDRLRHSADFQAYRDSLSGSRRRGSSSYNLRRQLARSEGAEGVLASVEGLTDPRGLDQQEAAARNIMQGGDIAAALLHSTRGENDRAYRNRAAIWGTGTGGSNAREQFTNEFGSYLREGATGGGTMLANGLFRGVVSQTASAVLGPVGGGPAGFAFNVLGGVNVDPGNILGEQAIQGNSVRDLYIRARMQAGATREAAAQAYDRDPSQVIRSLGPGFMASQSQDVRRRLLGTLAVTDAFGGVGVRSGVRERIDENLRTGYRMLLGNNSSRSEQGALRESFDRVVGLRTGSDEDRNVSRSTVTALAAMYATAREGSQSDAGRIERQTNAMHSELNRRFGEDAALTMEHQAEAESHRLNPEQLIAARHLTEAQRGRSGTQVIEAVTSGFYGSRDAQGHRTGGVAPSSALLSEMRGMISLAGSNAAMGKILGHLTEDNYDPAEVARRLREATPEDLAELRQTAGGRQLANAMHRGDVNGVLDVGRRVDQITAARNRYDSEHHGGNRWARFMALGHYDEERAAYVQSQQRSSSDEEDNLNRDLLNSAGMETRAQGEGQGTDRDPLVVAARELHEAARLFREGASTEFLDAGVNPAHPGS